MKYYLYFFFLLLLLGCKDKLEKEQVIFQGYDFSNGDYKLLFYGQENEKIDGFDNFYIDDVETLQKIKKHWIISYKSEVMACGYTYDVNLVRNDIVIKNFYVNLECEYMSGMSDWLYFPKSYLMDYKKSFKKMDLK